MAVWFVDKIQFMLLKYFETLLYNNSKLQLTEVEIPSSYRGQKQLSSRTKVSFFGY